MNVTPSHYLENAFKAAGYGVKYIPNNIPLADYPFKLRTKASPKLLYVRALRNPYNPLMAVRVLAGVRAKLGEGELCMVGPANENMLDEVKKLAREIDVTQHIAFTGRLTKPEWIALSAQYDIFINTTDADNMPVSIIEAMALGFPIVSTNAGGLPYLIADGQDGLLVETGDAEAMADKIAEIIRNPDLSAKLSQNARNKAQTFDWEIVKELWKDLLGKVQ
jgi:glycosyltransferase involved in cell wall biosynthesis